jgi:hypothetical protein
MKIHAAARLLANADEAQARRYIKHVTDVEPLEKYSDTNDHISFYVDPRKAQAIKVRLGQQFTPVPLSTSGVRNSWSFYIDDTKTRIINIHSWVDTQHRALISLIDKNHYEDYVQRLLRLQAEGRKGKR